MDQLNNSDVLNLLTEVNYNFSRSGGKGGQNVNKVETKVELVFNVDNSVYLTEEQKRLIKEKLVNKIDNEGNFRITSQTERTQVGNRKKVIDKFERFLQNALKVEKKRKKTKISKSVKEKILEKKKKHGARKKERSYKVVNEE
ncbi:MAG: aminoacyl-tRNA hydrolase [Ignavibacteriae bacterium]|nr:MAG: aminoacyl-tRNA hydrolase [Ignavibacteriota bacterium]